MMFDKLVEIDIKKAFLHKQKGLYIIIQYFLGIHQKLLLMRL